MLTLSGPVTLDLTGLSTEAALRKVQRRFDQMQVLVVALVEADSIRDGVSRDTIDDYLEERREEFAEWRAEALIELRDWLIDCNRKLH